CYLVSVDGVDDEGQPKTWRVVMDLGNGALGTLQRYVALEDIDAILLSHLHPDHFMDLCGLHVWCAGTPMVGIAGASRFMVPPIPPIELPSPTGWIQILACTPTLNF